MKRITKIIVITGIFAFSFLLSPLKSSAQQIHYLTTIQASRYVSGKDSNLIQRFSVTNNDSAFFQQNAVVGTKGDSLADSTFFYYNLTPSNGGPFNIGFQEDNLSDTLCDSVFIYVNKILLLKQQFPAALPAINMQFSLTPSGNAGTSRPELITVKSKWKLKTGKGTHYLRIRPNYIIN